MYTDNTILTSGQYRFIRLGRVPAYYLLNIYKSNNQQDKELYAFVSSNLERIKSLNKVATPLPKLGGMRCNKFTYCSEKEAKHQLHRIEKRVQENNKPKRAYECSKCSGWHLTSIPYEKWDVAHKPAGVLQHILRNQTARMPVVKELSEYGKGYHRSRLRLKTGCEKFAYESEKEARIQVQNIEKTVPEYKKSVRPYPCRKCGGWHLTSVPYEKWEVSFKRADVVNQTHWLQGGGHYRLH